MNSLSLMILNGGVGSRINSDVPKQFVRVNGIPLLIYSLLAVENISQIEQIIVNYPAGFRESTMKLVQDYGIKKQIDYIEGGRTRQESVRKMLDLVRHENVIIHESARPAVTEEDFMTLITAPEKNIGFGFPIPFTVAPVDPEKKLVQGVLQRNSLRNIQLPQKFSTAELKEAHAEAERKGLTFTEDMTLVHSSGFPVYYLDGKEENIKVTNPLDLAVVETILRAYYEHE